MLKGLLYVESAIVVDIVKRNIHLLYVRNIDVDVRALKLLRRFRIFLIFTLVVLLNGND